MLVIASMPWSSTFLSMISTRSSRAFHVSRAGEDLVELRLRADRQAEVVEARAGHRRVVGDEEHELLDVVHLEHLAVAILGQHRQVVEAEHVAEEVGAQLAVLLVELVGREAHRDVVEARLARRERRARSAGFRWTSCVLLQSTRGTIMALAATVPSCSPSAVSSSLFSG